MENSSQVGVLTIMRSHKKGIKTKVPSEVLKEKILSQEIQYDNSLSQMSRAFKNVYPIRTYRKDHFKRAKNYLNADLVKLEAKSLFRSEGDIEILCSSRPELILGKIKYNTPDEVNEKINDLFEGFKTSVWSDNEKIDRFASLSKLADLMLINREELTSLIMLEAGKTVDEAIGDVDEAIDFVNFYSREQVKLQQKFEYQPRGVVGVIAPWNFPLAISCGMSVAALCAGNVVILKPAEQTPLIALRFQELCFEAGIPKDVFQIALGEAEVGKAIVNHELIVGIVFTGSKAVGEHIFKSISKSLTSARYDFSQIPKFAITEMGGKNAIIVTNNSELDETVSGIIYSAFAHSGQKCSAASRIIIDEQLKDAFTLRFSKAVADLKVGTAIDFSTIVNPLITKHDQERVREMAQIAAQETRTFGGKIIVDRSQEEVPGYCVGPSVFELAADITMNNDTIASKEVFGPILHLIPYKTLDQAIEIFNSTEYALTGGIFCQSQDDLDYIVPKLEAGNIYVNRPNTGARVAIEPFGGFKKSGTGPKAGGKEYMGVFNRSVVSSMPKASKPVFDIEKEVKNYISHASKVSQSKRIYNTKKLVSNLLQQFEVYFGIITKTDKNKLLTISKALGSDSFNIDEKQFPNRYIPGQISYNKKNLSIGRGFLVDSSEKLEISTIIDLLIHLSVGNGVSIIATNQEVYNKWRTIIDLVHRCGFSQYNISLSSYKKDSLLSLLKKGEYEFILFANTEIKSEIKEIIFNRDFTNHLVKVFYCGENQNWRQGLDRFTRCRSFAINTMRHGAPLELSL